MYLWKCIARIHRTAIVLVSDHIFNNCPRLNGMYSIIIFTTYYKMAAMKNKMATIGDFIYHHLHY